MTADCPSANVNMQVTGGQWTRLFDHPYSGPGERIWGNRHQLQDVTGIVQVSWGASTWTTCAWGFDTAAFADTVAVYGGVGYGAYYFAPELTSRSGFEIESGCGIDDSGFLPVTLMDNAPWSDLHDATRSHVGACDPAAYYAPSCYPGSTFSGWYQGTLTSTYVTPGSPHTHTGQFTLRPGEVGAVTWP
jgi:hypothetical protein